MEYNAIYHSSAVSGRIPENVMQCYYIPGIVAMTVVAVIREERSGAAVMPRDCLRAET
jgi:hypothetical protein